MKTLLDVFNNKYKDILTKKNSLEFIKYIKVFELRDEHPYFLNSPYLGLNRFVFKKEDRDNIFDIFNVDELLLKDDIKKYVISYNEDFEVSSDIFNIFIMWLSHLCLNNKTLSKKNLYEVNLSGFNMLHYKFLSSKLFRDYRFKPNKDVMKYTIESLSNKFDIVKYKTWKNLIYNRSKELIDKSSIHYKFLKEFKPDKEIYYTITNLQTKLRSTINIINRTFYQNLESNNVIQSYDASKIIDGEKVLKDPEMFYDKIFYYINNQLYNRNQFINHNYIESLLKMFPGLSYPLSNKFLNYICNTALEQRNDKKLKPIINRREYIFYNDIKLLINTMITNIFSQLISKRININNKISVFNNVKDIFKSKKTNKTFSDIKMSLIEHINRSKISRRYATINSLINFFILYIVLKIFEVL